MAQIVPPWTTIVAGVFLGFAAALVCEGQSFPEAFVEFPTCTLFAAIFGRDSSVCDYCCEMNSNPTILYNPEYPGFGYAGADGIWRCYCAANNECTPQHRDPDQCIATPGCNYCLNTKYESNRCNYRNNLLTAGCPTENIIDKIEKSAAVTPGDKTPPPILLPIVPGTKTRLSVTFRLAKHPLDVYYLMDFSGSMSDDKQNVVRLAGELVKTVRDLSTDTTIGFGTFVDKPKSPFGYSGSGDYSFRNDRRLSSGNFDLAAMVEAIPIRNGGDGPESQADAMHQAAICTTEIGWRSFARHLLILATDASYHKAGDGAAGDILTPYDDSRCYLNDEGYYSEEVTRDYPSDAQLVQAFNDHKITPIFAVYNTAAYQDLASKLPTASIGPLSSDSSNIVNIIREKYEKIENRFEMEQSHVSPEVQIKYFSNCKGGSIVETTVCNALSPDGTVTFNVEFDVSTCPKDEREWQQIVRLNPLGLPTHVDIALALLCKI